MSGRSTPQPISARVLAMAKRARVTRGMSQTQWAEALTKAGYETSRTSVMNHEKDRSTSVLGIDEAVALAGVMGHSLDALIEMSLGDQCETCGNVPPPGFTCQTCGRGGAE